MSELRGEWGSVLLDHKECEGPGCHAPVRSYEDFCSESCWEWWHAKYDPETLDKVNSIR
ncbi:hypothetical protein SEA_MARAV_79 [Streptomyces phage Marav]|nr:hypothetical protein SEA_MARAV_79 [Streptomyces phage Marav]